MESERATAVRDLMHMLDYANGLIANAGGGDWTKEARQWQAAAEGWREAYEVIRGSVRI